MRVEDYDFREQLGTDRARTSLIQLLQNAHAGERAAAIAYYGHAKSLFVTDKEEQTKILEIYKDELHHRERLFKFLKALQARPRTLKEVGMWMVGVTIAIFSYWGTWFIPMYGAGKLESTNIGEYEVAARLAYLAGEHQLLEELLIFAEIEWDHEQFFRKKAGSHILAKWIPLWPEPPKREHIRSSFQEFLLRSSLP